MTSEKTLPSKYSNLVVRLFSALVALSILLISLYYFKLTGAIFLVLIVSALIAFEFTNLFFNNKKIPDIYIKFFIPVLISTSLWFSIQSLSLSSSPLPDKAPYALLPILIGLISIPWFYRLSPIQETFDKLVVYLLIVFYCYFLPLKILEIFKLDERFYFFCFFGLLVFGTDTLAYFFGKKFGRKYFTKAFQPQISPSKTYEGFLGSLVWPIVLILITQQLQIFDFNFLGLFFCYLTTLTAISGDLIASLIKRKSTKKDSGTLFIGHGGFLDRLDSLLLSAPIFLMAVPHLTLL